MNTTIHIRSKPKLINQASRVFTKYAAGLGISVLTMASLGTVNAQRQRNVMEVLACDLNGYAFEGMPFGTYDFGGSAGIRKTGAASIIFENFAFPRPRSDHGDSPLYLDAGQLRSTSQIDLFGYGSDYYYIRFVRGAVTVYAGAFDDGSGGRFGPIGGSLVIELHKGSLLGPVVGGNPAIVSEENQISFQNNAEHGNYSAAPPEDALIIEGVNHDIPDFDPAREFWPVNVSVHSHTDHGFVDANGALVTGLLNWSFRPARKSEPPSVFVDKVPNPNSSPNGRSKNSNTSQNGGFYLVRASSNSDPQPKIFVQDSSSGFEAGPFDSGEYLHMTRARDDDPSVQFLTGVVTGRIIVQGDALIYAVDLAGNVSQTIDVTLKSGN